MAQTAADEQGLITLGEVSGAMRRQRRVVAICVALAAVAGVFLAARSAGGYTAEARLIISPITTDPFASNSRPVDAVNPETERGVLLSSDVAEEVITKLDLDTTPDDLLGRVTAENPEGSVSLIVTATAFSSPERSQELANEFAQVYLDQRTEVAQESIGGIVATIDEEIATTQTELAEAVSQAAKQTPGSLAADQAQAEVATLRTRVSSLEDRRAALISTRSDPGRITRTANLPESRDGIPSFAVILGAMMAGLTVGIVAALFLDRRKGLVQDRSVFEALVPGAELVILGTDPLGLDAALGAAAYSISHQRAGPITAVMSTTEAEAPRLLGEKLVESLVSAGSRVLVIWTGSADGVDPEWSMTALDELCSGSLAMLPTGASEGEALWILPAFGASPAALARPHAPSEVDSWADSNGFDVVLLLSPSPRLQPAASVFATNAGIVAVSSLGPPKRSELIGTVTALQNSGVGITLVLIAPENLITDREPTEQEPAGEERSEEEPTSEGQPA